MYEEYLQKALSNVIMARQALYGYKAVHQKDLKNGASYHAQQAIELLVKYNIYNNEIYRNSNNTADQIRTHDLDKLIKVYCIPFEIHVPEKIIKNAKVYSSWEAESRYSLKYSVRVDSIINALDEAEKWLIQLKPMYKAKIADVRRKLDII